jgi:hypothetical protein
VAGIAGAGDDRQVGVLRAQLLDQPLGEYRLVHGQDHRAGRIEPEPGQRALRGVAEEHRKAARWPAMTRSVSDRSR